MTKKISKVEDWITAKIAAQILSLKCGFPVDPEYIVTLSKRKKNPVRTRDMSGHKLYSKQDIQNTTIRRRVINHDQK